MQAVELIEKIVLSDDLSSLSPAERAQHYLSVCNSLGLNPATRPLDYLRLNGRLTLYARREAAAQLARLHRVSTQILSEEARNGLYVVRMRASTPDGRVTDEIGFAAIEGLAGEALGNAVLRAVTKARRRAILSHCGLGMLDETEVEDIPEAEKAHLHIPLETADSQPEPEEPETPPELKPLSPTEFGERVRALGRNRYHVMAVLGLQNTQELADWTRNASREEQEKVLLALAEEE
jgi:hypothetical protein